MTALNPYWLYGRQAIADYLHVTRMTLHRWEKLVALGWRKGGHLGKMRTTDIDEWAIKVHIHPKYNRPHSRRVKYVTPRRRDVTRSRCGNQDIGDE